jgi:3-dehydroquinate synthase
MTVLPNCSTPLSGEFAPIQQQFFVPFHYDVYFTDDLLQLENPMLANIISPLGLEETLAENLQTAPKVLTIVDDGLLQHSHLLGKIMAYAQAYSQQMALVATPLVVPGGETAKNTPALVDQLCHVMETWGLGRHSYVLVFGGGAVLDLVGYAAAMVHRGIRLIRVPTTVLGQNNAGGCVKNGINAFGKKDFLGTFAPPFAVINDFSFLMSLSDRDWRAGIAEAVKVALIKDRDFFEQIEQDAEALANRCMAAMKRLIYRCVQLQLEHIASSGDPFESGASHPLDFGHWSAHRLELMTHYRLRHGEALAIGIALDTLYSQLSGILLTEDALRILDTLQKLGFSLVVPELFHALDYPEHSQSFFRGLKDFQEYLGGQLAITLLWSIGQSIEVHEVVLQHYREAIVIVAELSLTNSNTSAMNLVIGPRTHDSPSFTMPSHVSH